MPQDRIRVLIADDHPIIFNGLRAMPLEAQGLAIVGMAHSIAEVTAVLRQTAIDVLILDLSGMGGSPLALVRQLRQEQPELRIVVFSSSIDMAPELLRRGVAGYVAKEERIDELIAAMTAITSEPYLSPIVRAYLAQTQSRQPISPRELLALKLLVQGLTTIEIAEQMDVDPSTVQNHITALRRKTGCSQRIQLADYYRRAYGAADADTP
jgi:DNA-binding NarL/FixJ family response regulator